MPLAKDLLHPTKAQELRTCKLKRLVPCPNSYFMDVKCPGCLKISTLFSHSHIPIACSGCERFLCTPKCGKARLTPGCSFRRKAN